MNDLLYEIETRPELSVKFSKNKMSGYLFADDFVGIPETRSALQILSREKVSLKLHFS